MKARLLELSLSLDRKQRVTLELEEDFRKTYDRLKEEDVDFTVKQYREKRSLTANAYAWVLIDKIAEKRRMSKIEVYRNAIRDIGGVSSIICIKTIAVADMKRTWEAIGTGWQAEELDSDIPGWTNLILHKGSSVYNTEQMAALIDSLIQDAQAIGIETRPQEEIDSLLAEYERMEEKKRAEQDFYNGAAYEGA